MEDKKVNEINRTELAELMARVEHAIEHDLALSIDDLKLLLNAITTLCTLQSKIEQDDITLHKLRKLLGMIKQSEKRRGKKSGGKGNKKTSNKPRSRKPKSTTKPKVAHHKMQAHQKGEVCPACERGKLYKFEPAKLLRITGHARFEATHHIVEQLRCNACELLYKAPLPDTVLEDGDADQKYGYSARTLMVIDKFYTGTPYYHQATLSDLFGCSISASTIFDQCEYVANDVMPVFYELRRGAADAGKFNSDDTNHRILEQEPELRDNPNGKGQRLRTGVYCSGLIATLANGHQVILFETSLGHAGEHLNEILKKRTANLPPPLVMSDASSNNGVVKIEIIQCYCNAHARRLFYDLEEKHPVDVEWLLETYGKIWVHDEHAKDNNMDDSERLAYHKEHSLPVMQSIYDWAINKMNDDCFEEHSPFGKAIKYFIKHFEKLTMFCKVPGAAIDNNPMEEKLKTPIRGRKTAHFYKTANGAGVANVLISLLATTARAGENVYEYFLALQKHRERVKANAAAWLPWNYRETLAQLTSKKTKPTNDEVVNNSS